MQKIIWFARKAKKSFYITKISDPAGIYSCPKYVSSPGGASLNLYKLSP